MKRSPWYWLKRLLACNPFFLGSAALLLFGMYRISIDPNFLPGEVGQLVFNFTALQFYELLLVGTAIVLARRFIWYDSMLLVGLENLLVLVPFMLISQAALIEQKTVWLLCGVTMVLVVGRTGAARQWISVLKPSPRLFASGMAALVVNAALPIIFRHFQETKTRAGYDDSPARDMNEASWLLLLPMLCALANLLPRPREDGKLLVQRRWFPVGLFLAWVLGTGVHLYALGYIYEFPLRPDLVAPVLWMLAWTIYVRLSDFVPEPKAALRIITLLLPLPVTLVSLEAVGSNVFFALSALNVVAFGLVYWRQRDNRLALHLTLVSLAAAVAALPVEVVHPVVGQFDRSKFIGSAVVIYLIVCCGLSRHPKVAILGMFAAGFAGGMLRGYHNDTMHWALQAGLVYFLLHSLRWHDYEHEGATTVRTLAALIWILQTFVWVSGHQVPFVFPIMAGGIVLAAYCFVGFVLRNWCPAMLPIAAALVMVSSPSVYAAMKLQTTPAGVIAIGASFLLFAIGTAVALTKHRWHHNG